LGSAIWSPSGCATFSSCAGVSSVFTGTLCSLWSLITTSGMGASPFSSRTTTFAPDVFSFFGAVPLLCFPCGVLRSFWGVSVLFKCSTCPSCAISLTRKSVYLCLSTPVKPRLSGQTYSVMPARTSRSRSVSMAAMGAMAAACGAGAEVSAASVDELLSSRRARFAGRAESSVWSDMFGVSEMWCRGGEQRLSFCSVSNCGGVSGEVFRDIHRLGCTSPGWEGSWKTTCECFHLTVMPIFSG
jgi:hypothetical protein